MFFENALLTWTVTEILIWKM